MINHQTRFRLTLMFCLSLTHLSVAGSDAVTEFDPTRPDSMAAGLTGQQPWTLTSTLITSQRKRAVINGVTVTGPGDSIFGATVKEIRTGAVEIETVNGTITLLIVDGTNH